ncbi:MAG: putative metal transporter CNNM2 [Streblomastix strix]|uniref:Putative metal transporter CNNM2 n=1 Tax=Streblomastix strix TaxID=222440 RepID=A0A5J4TN59_9EUKA|nr:MAG: putative metal transporter CNNM2 [Streblomastix strix]
MISIVFIIFIGALFSGLNLGLLSLDKINLQILNDLGSEKDKRRVKRIMRVRKHGNVLLCTLQFANVMTNVALSLIIGDIANPIVSFFVSTIITVIFGEIIPQAICSRYALQVGSALWLFVYIIMIILSPVAYPLGMLLDCILGQEGGYNVKIWVRWYQQD